MARSKHPNKGIEFVLKEAEKQGWRILKASGHAGGRMFCPYNDEQCRCGSSIWSTARNPTAHARQILRVVLNCTAHIDESQLE